MKALVTGAAGFIGRYLVELLLAEGYEVDALVRRGRAISDSGPLRVHDGDVRDCDFIGRFVSEVKPDVIFHLAGQSLPGLSWERPDETFQTNVIGTLNMLEATRSSGGDPVIVVACSSAEYAPRPDGLPISEEWPLHPSSPYGVSKLAQDHLARLYAEAHSLRVVRARPFFLIGPRKEGDVSSDFARGIVAIERGRLAELSVGNLDVVRDFLDVRDGVSAFLTLADRGRPGDVYNIASGRGYRVGELYEIMKGLARIPIRERVDPSRLRPIEEMVKIGDPAKLAALGWKPAYPIEKTLAEILDYWRDAGGRGA